MSNLTHDHPPGQELFHFCHFDHNTYESLIKSPGRPPIPFLQAAHFDCSGCFILKKHRPGEIPPRGTILIPTVNVPRGSLQVFARALLFYLVPMLKDQPRQAVIVHNPDLDPGPSGIDDVAMLVITQAWLPQDPDPQPDPLPEEKRPHLHIVKSQKQQAPPKVRRNKAPKDVLKYFSKYETRLTWQPVLKYMYKRSKYLERKRLTHYTGHYNRQGRFYLKGNESMATSLGMSPWSLSHTLSWMKKQSLIYLRKRGYPGEGNSIWELPFNLAHVFAWSRESPRLKTYLP